MAIVQNRFSSLKQINKNNLEKLDLDYKFYLMTSVKCIVAENFLFHYNKKIISLDAVKEIWELIVMLQEELWFTYIQTSKLFFPSYKNLVSINASDGTSLVITEK